MRFWFWILRYIATSLILSFFFVGRLWTLELYRTCLVGPLNVLLIKTHTHASFSAGAADAVSTVSSYGRGSFPPVTRATVTSDNSCGRQLPEPHRYQGIKLSGEPERVAGGCGGMPSIRPQQSHLTLSHPHRAATCRRTSALVRKPSY